MRVDSARRNKRKTNQSLSTFQCAFPRIHRKRALSHSPTTAPEHKCDNEANLAYLLSSNRLLAVVPNVMRATRTLSSLTWRPYATCCASACVMVYAISTEPDTSRMNVMSMLRLQPENTRTISVSMATRWQRYRVVHIYVKVCQILHVGETTFET